MGNEPETTILAGAGVDRPPGIRPSALALQQVRSAFIHMAATSNKATDEVRTGETTRRVGTGLTARKDTAWLGDYSSTKIKARQLELMRNDPQIKLGLLVLKAPIMAAFEAWRIESENPMIAAFVTKALEPIMDKLVTTAMESLDYGHAPHEKVWTTRDVSIAWEDEGGVHDEVVTEAWVYKDLKDLQPWLVEYIGTGAGDFDGFVYNQKDRVSAEMSWVVTHEKRFGNIKGNSVLTAVYDPWYWWSVMNIFANRYFERRASPFIKARAPAEVEVDASGNEDSGIKLMMEMLYGLKESGVFALPSEVDPDTKQPLWDAEFMSDDQRGEMFQGRLEYLDALKLRALGIPDQVATLSDKTGSYGTAVTHTETFIGMLTALLKEILSQINKFLLPQLVEFNFGKNAAKARMIVETGILANRELAGRLLHAIIQQDNAAEPGAMNKVLDNIDIVSILKSLNLPTTTPSKKKAQAKKQLPSPDAKEDDNELSWNDRLEVLLSSDEESLEHRKVCQKAAYEMLKAKGLPQPECRKMATAIVQARSTRLSATPEEEFAEPQNP